MACRRGAKYAGASDEELMLWFYGCDDRAFDELWECRLSNRLKGFVVSKIDKRIDKREDVKDIVSEVSFKIVQTKHHLSARFNPQRGNLRSWVAGIASNEIANHFRKRNQSSSFNELTKLEEDDEYEFPEISETMLADKSDEEREAIIRDAVQRLEEPSRTIVMLLFWRDFTEKEISEELGIPLATVHRRLKHDLDHLKKMLER